MTNTTTENDIFKTNKMARAYRYYMLYFVAIFGYAWIYIFAAHILISKAVDGVSLPAVIIHMSVTICWMVYGFLRSDKVIIVGSIISIIGNLFSLIAIFIVTTL